MITPPAPVETPSPVDPLPSELEGKLRTCEAIAARMSMLQRQVDLEREQLRKIRHEVPERTCHGVPAIRPAVTKLLRWLREKVLE